MKKRKKKVKTDDKDDESLMNLKRNLKKMKKKKKGDPGFKTLLKRLSNTKEPIGLSPFKRNGKLEVVMVTGCQFEAVQDYIVGNSDQGVS